MTVRELDKFFREKTFVARAINVGQKIIEAIEARAVHVTDARHLNGGGTIRRHAQTLTCSVPAQVEEDVNFVGANQFGRVLVRQRKNISPAVGTRANLLRDKIFFIPRRVKISFKKIFVELGEQRTRPMNHNMGTKKSGEKSHADFSVREKFFRKRF